MIEPSRELRDVCAIVGAGNSRLGRVPGVSSFDLLVEAMHNAIVDAGVKVTDIDGIICRGPDESYAHHQLIGARPLGINARFSTTLDNGGASRFWRGARHHGDQGRHGVDGDHRLRPRFRGSRTHSSKEANLRNQTRPDSQPRTSSVPNTVFCSGCLAAFGATRHMHLYGTTRDQFGAIAVAFREHALRNPDAQMKKPLTMAQYHEAAPGGGAVRTAGLQLAQRRRRRRHRHQPRTRARDLRQPPVPIKGFGSSTICAAGSPTTTGDNSGEEQRRSGVPHGGRRAGRCRHRADL